MAEHRNVDPGPGPTFAPVAIDVDGSGDEWQRIKVGYGPDGTPADVTTANPLPVVQTGTPALPTGAATSALQSAEATLVGAVTETPPGTDTASSGLNGRLQRIAQRLTSLLAVLPAALGQTTKAGSLSVTLASNQDALPVTDNSGSLTVDAPVGTPAFVRLSDGSAAITTLPVSAASLPLPTGAALDATVGTTNTEIGGLTESAPGTDTASSGLNGRLQRVAQRLTSLIALLPASLGQKTMANGLAVTIASDQTVVPVSDNAGSLTVDNGGTFAVQDSQKLADNAAFTDGTTPVQPSGFVFDEVAGTALTENDIAAGRVDSKRAQVGVVEDATTRGQRLAITAANAAKVDGSAVTQPVSAAALPLPSGAATEATLAAQTKVDNAAFTDGTTPVSPVGYVFDEVAGTALTENDVAAARIDSKRGQVSVIEDATTRGQRAVVSAAGRLSVDASGVAVPITDNSGSLTVDNAGTFAVQPTQPSASTAAPASFTATSSTTIFSSNASAKLRTFSNDSNQDLYLILRAAAVSVAAGGYSVKVPGNGGFFTTDYTGEVRGIMAAAITAGQVNVGEYT